ncbi:MAG: D-2-hydroxyacid dehydrogenase [Clostridiales bacterium]|nr:D-2-hydroxyacid dehydrogenase [Clostridiales bacterium]
MKIVVLDGYVLNPGDMSWTGFDKFGEIIVYDRTPNEKIIERIGDAEAVLTNKTPLRRETLEKLSNLKYIGVLATGFNVVDIDAATKNGITVTNIPGYSTDAVAQMVMALLLELCHHTGDHSKEVKAGAWSASKDFAFWHYPLVELKEKTIGIIGFGKIGKAVAGLAKAFGMNILYNSRTRKEYAKESDAIYTDLNSLIEQSDVISLNCPLTDETRNLINKETLAKMKKSSFLINTARGPIVNENDLAEALNTDVIAGAAVDVLSREPADKENPLLNAKNCIITPHIAWATKEARERLMAIAIENVKAYIERNPQNLVN